MPLSTKLDKRNEDIKIYINGEFFHRDQAKISVFDSGFLLGDGIWEGIRLVNNSWLFLDEHLDRLYEGCKAIDIRLDEDKKFLTNAIIETQKINNITDALKYFRSNHQKIYLITGSLYLIGKIRKKLL